MGDHDSMKIIAVEDDPVAPLVPEAPRRQLDHKVVLAADGAAAWARLQANSEVRVVVNDWLMLGLGGPELSQRIRARAEDCVYFIWHTQYPATDENHEGALTAGVDDFWVKPINQRELRMRLCVAERSIGDTKQLRRLESLLPTCACCKNGCDDQDYWQDIESFLRKDADTNFSHEVCVRNVMSNRFDRCCAMPGAPRCRMTRCSAESVRD
jgi:DNA-binding response OmpR family regulator